METAEFNLIIKSNTAGAREAEAAAKAATNALQRLEAASRRGGRISAPVPTPPRPGQAFERLVKQHSRAIERRELNKSARIAALRSKGMDAEADKLAGVAKAPDQFEFLSKGLRAAGFDFGTSKLIEMGAAASMVAAAVYGIKKAFDFVAFSVKTVLDLGIQLGAAFLTMSAQMFDFGQRSRLAFSSLLGNENQGVTVFNKVRKEAQDLGLDVEDTVDSYRKLLAAQFTVGESNELIRATADMRALGASTQDVGHALLAISQIKMKGKLQAEELTRQLANAGVSTELVYQALQRRMGLSMDAAGRKKVLALQKAGQISSDVAIPAIIDAIKAKSHEQNAGDVAKTFANQKISGMLGQLQGMGKNFFIDIGAEIEKPVTEAAKTIFATLKSLFDSPLMAELKTSIAEVFVASAEFVMKYWPQVEPVIVGVLNQINIAFNNLGQFISSNGDVIAEKLGMIANVAYMLGNVMLTVTGIVFKVVDAFMSLVTFFDQHPLLSKLVGGAAVALTGLSGGLALPVTAPLMAATGLASFGGGLPSGPTNGDPNAVLSDAEARRRLSGGDALAGVLGRINDRSVGIAGSNAGNAWKSIGTVNNNLTVNALDPDPEVLGEKLAPIIRNEFQRIHEDSE